MIALDELFELEVAEDEAHLEEMAAELSKLPWHHLVEAMQLMCDMAGYDLEYGEVEAESFAVFGSSE